MRTQDKLMTVDEFEKLYMDRPYELVEGVVRKVMPGVYSHGQVTRRVAKRLGDFVDANDLGEVVGAETGFALSAHTLRAPDSAFLSKAKIAQITDPDKFPRVVPDLAVEVVSPGDRKAKVQQKVDLYLQAGVRLVWVLYLKKPRVVVHEPGKAPQTVLFDGGDVLPGLQIAVSDLFPPSISNS